MEELDEDFFRDNVKNIVSKLQNLIKKYPNYDLMRVNIDSGYENLTIDVRAVDMQETKAKCREMKKLCEELGIEVPKEILGLLK